MGFLFGTSVALADGAAAAETSDFSLNVGETLMGLVRDTGFGAFFVGDGWKMLVMIIIGCVLLYLAIHKGFEPLLLLPIGFGMILSNLPLAGLMDEGGLLYYLYLGVKLGIYPPLIFLGVGAMTDFGPLIANPKIAAPGRGGAAGHLHRLHRRAYCWACTPASRPRPSASSAARTALPPSTSPPSWRPNLLGPIAVAAYSYMALVPVIQPPIMKLPDHQEGAHDQHGAAAPGFQDGKDRVPDRGYHRRCLCSLPSRCSAGRHADAG